MRASIIIRTLNEAEHLDDLLTMLGRQITEALEWEVVLIDSWVNRRHRRNRAKAQLQDYHHHQAGIFFWPLSQPGL